MNKLVEEGIILYRAEDEADSLIVYAAINYYSPHRHCGLRHETDF